MHNLLNSQVAAHAEGSTFSCSKSKAVSGLSVATFSITFNSAGEWALDQIARTGWLQKMIHRSIDEADQESRIWKVINEAKRRVALPVAQDLSPQLLA